MTRTAYYEDKLELLADLFGATEVALIPGGLSVDGRRLPVIDDVIILLDEHHWPPLVRERISPDTSEPVAPSGPFSSEIQQGFGAEWTAYPRVLPEHKEEFEAYFDLVDLESLAGARVADLGCGIGRWSYFLADRCRELVLVDFSEAVFVARENLRHAPNAVFMLGDVTSLPFRRGAFDFTFCLGVLHHLPIGALDALRRLAPLARRHLVYLYYSLDNRPAYYRVLLRLVTVLRKALVRIHNPRLQGAITSLLTAMFYVPAARVGALVGDRPMRRYIPLAEVYSGKSFGRLRQDVHDRFFTSIEQRFSRRDIREIADVFGTVRISESPPYWHFLCGEDA